MRRESFVSLLVLLTTVPAVGCVRVVEREVYVETPVYIHLSDAGTSCSAPAPISRSTPPNEAPESELQMRGSAASMGGMSASSLVAMQFSMGLGPGMSLDERERLENKVQTVLETGSDGASVRWVSDDSGRVINMVASETHQERRLVTVARGEEVGRMPDSFVVEPAVYVTTEAATLRPTPSSTSIVSGGDVPPGAKVRVLGRVTGVNSDSWLLVGGPDGTALGFLEPAQLRPNETNLVPSREIYSRPTGVRIRDAVSASVMCRTLVYGSGDADNVMRTCREPGGRWISNPPVMDAGQACRAEPRPAFLLDREL